MNCWFSFSLVTREYKLLFMTTNEKLKSSYFLMSSKMLKRSANFSTKLCFQKYIYAQHNHLFVLVVISLINFFTILHCYWMPFTILRHFAVNLCKTMQANRKIRKKLVKDHLKSIWIPFNITCTGKMKEYWQQTHHNFIFFYFSATLSQRNLEKHIFRYRAQMICNLLFMFLRSAPSPKMYKVNGFQSPSRSFCY